MEALWRCETAAECYCLSSSEKEACTIIIEKKEGTKAIIGAVTYFLIEQRRRNVKQRTIII